MKICKITSSDIIDYAASELRKYLHMMMPELGFVEISFNPEAKDGFRLGLMQDFGLDVSDAEDMQQDDILYIEADVDGGIIAGNNYRSVLLAVYEYLRQNGCRWLMPGKSGEFIPMKDVAPVSYRHKATTRVRGWCNEGSISQEALIDMVEFTPKIGMNTVMLQWRLPYGFYERHYEHLLNQENRSRDSVSKPQMLQWTKECEEEIHKRGLMLHTLGHGVMTDGMGMDASACWAMNDEDVPKEISKYFALINGERKLFGRIPTNTNFCMSEKIVRENCINYVVNYAKTHTNVDYLHVWLGDGFNNYCECDECRKKRPSDWYVIFLNELDEALTRENMDTKIVFIQYVDLCWAPLEEKIKNPERFTLGTGYSSRTLTRTLKNDGSVTPAPEFKLNNIELVHDLDESFALHREYKKAYDREKFAFEYHFWWGLYMDIAGKKLPLRLEEDLKAYKNEGFGGFIHFICPRHSFPNGHVMYSHARNMFDDTISLDDIRRDYFDHAYGEYADEVLAFFDKVADVFEFDYALGAMGNEKGRYCNPEIAEKLKKASELSKEAIAIADKMQHPLTVVQAISGKLLYYYGLYIERMGEFLSVKASGDNKKAKELFEKFRVDFGALEAEIQNYYDHHMVIKSFRTISEDLGFVIQ